MVTIDSIEYSLTDLNPNDGIAPSVNLADMRSFEDTYNQTDSRMIAGGSLNWLVSPNTAIQFTMQVTATGTSAFDYATAGIGAEGTDEFNTQSARGVFNETWTLSTTFANSTGSAVQTGYGYNLAYGTDPDFVPGLPNPVPEPATWAMLSAALVLVAFMARVRGRA